MNNISCIVAVDQNYAIGKGVGELLFKNKTDMAFFNGFTQGKAVLVGYNTLQTLPKLTGRQIIPDPSKELVLDLKHLIHNQRASEVVVIGGDATYKKYANQIESVYITIFNETVVDADKYFCYDLFEHLDERIVLFKTDEFRIERWN